MKYSWTIALLFALWACDPARVYERNVDLAEAVWHKDSLVHFQINVADTSVPYHLSVNVRNASAYPYYNLYLKYALTDSVGKILHSELKDFHLFDPKSGRPLGDGLGDLFDHRFRILENMKFPGPGSYRLSVQHYMRVDQLPLVVSVGARLEKVVEE